MYCLPVFSMAVVMCDDAFLISVSLGSFQDLKFYDDITWCGLFSLTELGN